MALHGSHPRGRKTDIGGVTMWKEIRGYEGIYEVSKDGRVRRIAARPANHFMRELVPWRTGPGEYLTVGLRRKGESRKNFYVHVLVAREWVPNPLNLPEVNHDDGDKDHNNDSNLVWSTRSGNLTHKNRIILSHHNQVDIIVTCPDGREQLVRNATEFCENNGLLQSGLAQTLSGRCRTYKGFSARYL